MIHTILILSLLYRISIYFLFLALFPLQHIYAIIVISLHRTAGPLRFLFFVIHDTFFILRPINRDYSRLSFDYIAYSTNNMGERCVFVICRQKGRCNSLVFMLLLFFYRIKNMFRGGKWVSFIVLHFVKSFLWYRSVLNQ